MDSDQTPINGEQDPQRRLPAPLENATLALEEKIVWPLQDGTKSAFEVIRWPFERLGWALQRALLWPLEDRTASLGRRGRIAATAGSAIAVAAIAGLVVV